MWKVDEQTAEQARKILHRAGRPFSFRRGEILMSFGAPSEDVVLIASGSVKVVLSEQTGAQLVAGTYGPGELIGELGVLDRRPRTATVVALQHGTGVRVAAPAFRELFEHDRNVMLLVNSTLRARLHQADNRQLAIASRNVATRVAAQLLEWAEKFGTPEGKGIAVRGNTQGDLAGAVVASAKSVDAALKSLRDDGLIRTRRLGYLLPDPALLASLLQRPGWRPGKRRSP